MQMGKFYSSVENSLFGFEIFDAGNETSYFVGFLHRF